MRPSSRTSPSTCRKIKYSSRSDTSGSCPTSDHRWSATQARLLAPHSLHRPPVAPAGGPCGSCPAHRARDQPHRTPPRVLAPLDELVEFGARPKPRWGHIRAQQTRRARRRPHPLRHPGQLDRLHHHVATMLFDDAPESGSRQHPQDGHTSSSRLSNPAGSCTTTPTRKPSASTAAPDIPAHRDPPSSGGAGGLSTSMAYSPAFTRPPGLIRPVATWTPRICGVATTRGNPEAVHSCPARRVTSCPERTGCRHPRSGHCASVISTSATSRTSSCHTTRAASRAPVASRTLISSGVACRDTRCARPSRPGVTRADSPSRSATPSHPVDDRSNGHTPRPDRGAQRSTTANHGRPNEQVNGGGGP